MQSLTEEEITILEKDTIDRWKDKIVNVSLYIKGNRNSYDLTIFHKVLGKEYLIDKDTINKLIGDCHTVDLHVLLTSKHHVLPVHDINKITSLDEDAFIQYLYDRIHNK